MTAFTPNMQLPYPTGSDRPCDGFQQITDLRNAIYDNLDLLYAGMVRQQEPPMLSVTATGPQSDGLLLKWQTVEQDDVNAIDLVVDNDAVILGKGNAPETLGTYIYGVNIEYPYSCIGFDVTLTPNTYDARPYDFDQGWAEAPPDLIWSLGSALLRVNVETKIEINLLMCGLGFTFARLWAVRIGEP